MIRLARVLIVALLAAMTAPVGAQETTGNWKVSYVTGGAFEQVVAIVKIQAKDGTATGTLVSASPRIKDITLKGISQEGDQLRVVFQTLSGAMTFEVRAPKSGAAKTLGAMSTDTAVYPAWLVPTQVTELDIKSAGGVLDCPPMQQARILSQKPLQLRLKAQQTKDAEQKKALLLQAAEADSAVRKETPKLYREILAKHKDSPAALEAALALIRTAQAQEAKPVEVKTWAMTAATMAKAFGPRYEGEASAQLASALITQEGFAGLAVDLAAQAEKSLTPKTSPGEQARVLGLLARALRKSGKEDEAKALDTRLAKLDEMLDKEYLAKMPGFKGSPFAGRKSKSERAVFLELFTGAACPPCVAADLAFDVLQKSYKPADLVLIQYHMHIPGPDPMTNPDTEARWKYYTGAFPTQVRGVPSSMFNGKPAAGGGGGATGAEKKYEAYRGVIDPLLEEPQGARLTAQAHRKGEKIDIQVEVNDLVGPDSQKKLRILLAEETIRYVGSNKIRFHHNVVRAFPGGVAGKPLSAVSSKHTATIDLAELRGQLTKYLDNYNANVRPFPNPARPLDFANLRVIAFVQDDTNHEILQAVQVEVEGGKK